MDSKTVTLIVVFLAILGVVIFLGKSLLQTGGLKNPINIQSAVNQSPTIKPTPTPIPTLPPLKEGADLEEELEKVAAPDFSNDYKALKDKVNQSL